MHSPFAAVFLDLDGTIVDSEPLHCEAHVRYLASQGITISMADALGNIGKSDRQFYKDILARHHRQGDVDVWMRGKGEMLVDLYRSGKLKLMSGVNDFLEHARFEGVPCMVVTSSDRWVAEAALEAVGLAERLPMRICHDDTPLRKPHPDPYLLAAQRLGVPAVECLVVEDSVYGVTAGVAAGAYTIAIRGHAAEEDIIKAGARRVIDCLTSLIPLTAQLNASDDGLPAAAKSREKTTSRYRRADA